VRLQGLGQQALLLWQLPGSPSAHDMTEIFVVVVKNNVVGAIERSSDLPTEPIAKTPLEVGTQLATNYRLNGCIDGRYFFEETQRAKVFASLCLEFTKALVEKRLAQINALPVGHAEYRPDDDRIANGTAPKPE
jgi:hypothetical protein